MSVKRRYAVVVTFYREIATLQNRINKKPLTMVCMMKLHGAGDAKVSKDLLKRSEKRLDSSELGVLKQLHKELASRSSSTGIDKETFLQYFNLPGLWGERLFRYFDINETSRVEFDEFITAISICCRGTPTEKIKVLFRVFDLNEDGVISKSELVAMLSNFPSMTVNMAPDCTNRAPSLSWERSAPSNLVAAFNSHESRVDSILNKIPKRALNTGMSTSHSGQSYCKSMSVKKTLHKDTGTFRDLVSSLSRVSLTSFISHDHCSKLDYTESCRGDHSNHEGDVYDSKVATPQTLHPSETPRMRSSTEQKLNKQHDNRRYSDFNSLGKAASAWKQPPNEPMSSSSFLDSPENEGQYKWESSSSNNFDDLSILPNLQKLSTDSTSGRAENVRRFIQGLDEAEIYRKSCCASMAQIHEHPGAYVSAMAIIDQERLTEADKTNMDVLVESILEEYDFNSNGHLDFDRFKAWISKNNSVLSMFSRYLHEEVWGLQGNAFMTSLESHELFMSHLPELPISTEDTSKHKEETVNTRMEYKDKVAQRMVYQMFLVNVSEAKTFNNCVLSLENVVSEELLQYLNLVSSKIKNNGKAQEPTKKEGAEDCCNPIGISNKEIFSCPNCATPFFMCPVCFKRHECLSLNVESGIYIVCENCSLKGQEMRFTSCWICDWNFEEAMELARAKRWQHRSQVMRRFRPRKPGFPRRRSPRDGGQSPSKTKRSEEAAKSSFLRSVISPLCSSSPLGRKMAHRATVPIPPNTNTSGELSKSSLEIEGLRTNGAHHGDWPILKAKFPTKTGYMYKRGRHFFKLQKRYYVLIDNLLYYYVDRNSAIPRGCIFLEGCYLDTVVKNDSMSTLYGLCICQKSNKANIKEFYVASKSEFFEWVEVLSVAMKQQRLMQLYNICEQLGHGKFSTVYRVIYKSTGEEFAVKVVDKTKLGSQERELLRSEIAILRLLRHQHVIYLKDVSDTRDSLYIVMELVRGGELYDLITQVRRLSEAHTHKIISQLLEIVAYLHKCGIIHRDIKPENILLTDKTEDATIKLTDFGLSTLCGPTELLTQPCGTLAYVAPEVLTLQGYNQKADVWSIGVIMYLLLRGRLPFSVKQPETMDLEHHYTLRFEGAYWENVSTSAKNLISRMLQVDPDKRISVFEALDHIWIKNFVAVNYDERLGAPMGITDASPEFIHSLRNTTDTTFVIPYSESCIQNLEALKNEAADTGDKTLCTVLE